MKHQVAHPGPAAPSADPSTLCRHAARRPSSSTQDPTDPEGRQLAASGSEDRPGLVAPPALRAPSTHLYACLCRSCLVPLLFYCPLALDDGPPCRKLARQAPWRHHGPRRGWNTRRSPRPQRGRAPGPKAELPHRQVMGHFRSQPTSLSGSWRASSLRPLGARAARGRRSRRRPRLTVFFRFLIIGALFAWLASCLRVGGRCWTLLAMAPATRPSNSLFAGVLRAACR